MNTQIFLKKNEEKRLLGGHQWIFSNEIEKIDGSAGIGDIAELYKYDGSFLGIGFYNPHSLISFRLLSRIKEPINEDFFLKRLQQAKLLREKLFPNSNTYRLVHSESDFLPGLIIDRYNEYCALQIFTAGMEHYTGTICNAIESLLRPKAIIARNDAALRSLEQLRQTTEVLRGTPGETVYNEEGIFYIVDILKGQKTGLFLDQRENRTRIRRFVKNNRVLDCFCNDGGFALHACSAGAIEVIGVDISEATIERAKINARMNNATNCSFVVADVFEFLKHQIVNNEQYDVIILDPPSFTKNKRSVPTALRGYKQLHYYALQLLKTPGFLITASCSHHITKEDFLKTIQEAGQKAKRALKLLEFHGASPDHPVLISMPETSYLKFAIFAVQ